MKTILLSAIAAFAIVSGAYAAEGAGDPFGRAGEVQSFSVSIPRQDTGSQAYPGGTSQVVTFSNLAMVASSANQVTGLRAAPAQRVFDTGSEQMPANLR